VVLGNVPTPTTRIMLVDLPAMLGEIICHLVADEAGMDVVAEIGHHTALVPAAVAAEADFVIAPLADVVLDGAYAQLLRRRPCTRLLAVSGDGRESTLIELAPTSTPVGELSAETLVGVIRGDGGPRPTMDGGPRH
jgi:hypothetical protein